MTHQIKTVLLLLPLLVAAIGFPNLVQGQDIVASAEFIFNKHPQVEMMAIDARTPDSTENTITISDSKVCGPAAIKKSSYSRDNDVSPFFSTGFEIEGIPYWGYVDKENNCLNFINIDEKNKNIRIDISRREFGELRTFSVWDKNHIFLFTKGLGFDKRLYLTNLEGELLQEYNYGEVINLDYTSPDGVSIENGITTPLYEWEDKLILFLFPYEKLGSGSGAKREMVGLFDTKTGEFEKLPIYHPQIYYESDYSDQYEIPYISLTGDDLIISFSGTADIYKYSLNNRELKEFKGSSEFLPGFNLPTQKEEKKYSKDGDPLRKTIGGYGPLVYDSQNKIFARRNFLGEIQKSSLEIEDYSESSIANSLMMFNSDFQLLGEALLPGEFEDEGMFSLNGNLFVQQREKISSDQITFSLIDLDILLGQCLSNKKP